VQQNTIAGRDPHFRFQRSHPHCISYGKVNVVSQNDLPTLNAKQFYVLEAKEMNADILCLLQNEPVMT
jgi:hypothetical protein